MFQKIGFAKDHYEGDESSFNWYAKGVPLSMDYGTYTPDAGVFGAHNLVEIPDADSLRRGYLADHLFTYWVDYTHSEITVSLKLQIGRLRTFSEIDGPPETPLFHYIGDNPPVGPKIWKVRQLLYVKPDYLVIFDRVFGLSTHRYNLHLVSDEMKLAGSMFTGHGRFEVDPLLFVQHPQAFRFETGFISPGPNRNWTPEDNPHRQSVLRLYNDNDGVYRTLLFARNPGQGVRIERAGATGLKVSTDLYTDYCFASDEVVREKTDEFTFWGRVGWIRRDASGVVSAVVPDGEMIEAFGVKIAGRGPWQYDHNSKSAAAIGGVPRPVIVTIG